MQLNPPILITGAHRSGTTWVGSIFRKSREVLYIPEPFNTKGFLRHRKLTSWNFAYITRENEAKMVHDLRELLRLHYPLAGLVQHLLAEEDTLSLPFPIHLGLLKQLSILRLYRLFRIRRNITPVFKDPIALLSVPWFVERFGARVLILIRHPAAYYSSIKRLNWRFDFSPWAQHPRILEDLLTPYQEQIAHPPTDHLSEACLLWNCLYHVVGRYQTKYPEWHFLRHEDLSRAPLDHFSRLFRTFQIELTPAIKKLIVSSSTGQQIFPAGDVIHLLERDSLANIRAWKSTLTADEILSIHRKTDQVASGFYGEEDW